MNTELNQISKEQQAEYDRYRHLFEYAPVGYFILNRDDFIIEVNRAGTDLLGYPKSYLLKNRFAGFIPPESLNVYHKHKKRAFETGQRQADEIKVIPQSGTPLYARIESIVIHEEGGGDKQIRIAVMDITDRMQAKEALDKIKNELEIRVDERTAQLREANASLQMEINARNQIEDELKRNLRFTASLLENLPIPIVVHDVNWKISYINKALTIVTGFTAGEIIGTGPPFIWWPPGKRSEYRRKLEDPSGTVVRRFERLFRKKNGERIWINLTATPIFSDGGEVISRLSIWEDITEQKESRQKLLSYQKDLQDLASRLVLTEQNERRNIAALIHDGVTQILSICAIKMEVLIDSISAPDVLLPLKEIYNLLQKAIEDTRTLAFELSPPTLYDLGLEAALEELVEMFGQKKGIRTIYDDDRQPKPLDESTSILLFQAVREILYGISRHAYVDMVKVSLKKAGDKVNIRIKGDGKGFRVKDPENYLKQIDEELFSIRERFRKVGGQVKVSSPTGKGIQFTLIAPLEKLDLKPASA